MKRVFTEAEKSWNIKLLSIAATSFVAEMMPASSGSKNQANLEGVTVGEARMSKLLGSSCPNLLIYLDNYLSLIVLVIFLYDIIYHSRNFRLHPCVVLFCAILCFIFLND